MTAVIPYTSIFELHLGVHQTQAHANHATSEYSKLSRQQQYTRWATTMNSNSRQTGIHNTALNDGAMNGCEVDKLYTTTGGTTTTVTVLPCAL